MQALKQVIEISELVDGPKVAGEDIVSLFKAKGTDYAEFNTIKGDKGTTDIVKIIIYGSSSKSKGRSSPTLGIIGRLGGVGARPKRIGAVSDADGAIAALSSALKLVEMKNKGDVLRGDVIVTTHICPNAPTVPHHPVPFMRSPVDIMTLLNHEVDHRMDAILSLDATKGNRIVKFRGFAITPTVKEGWILKVSDDLLTITEYVTGRIPRVVPITMQDITPYGTAIYHINTIMQPWLVTDAPVVGVAITTEVPVPGCATGASHLMDIEEATRFCIEVAKEFCGGRCQFYDAKEFELVTRLFGPMAHLRTTKFP